MRPHSDSSTSGTREILCGGLSHPHRQRGGRSTLYEVRGSEKIFRTEHQVATLFEKVNLPVNARVLDYGCGKASMLKGLCGRRDDVVPFVFDVGEQYRPFWNDFVPATNQA